MRRTWRVVAAVIAFAAMALAPAAFAQVGPSPLPPPPPELEPVTELLPPLGPGVCGTIDGTLTTALVELLGPWIAVVCPLPVYPPDPPVEDGGEPGVDQPVPIDETVIDPVLPLARPLPPGVVTAPTPTRRRTTPTTAAPRRPRAALEQTLASAPDGFEYRVVFLLPLALLGLGGYAGWLLNKPMMPNPRR